MEDTITTLMSLDSAYGARNGLGQSFAALADHTVVIRQIFERVPYFRNKYIMSFPPNELTNFANATSFLLRMTSGATTFLAEKPDSSTTLATSGDGPKTEADKQTKKSGSAKNNPPAGTGPDRAPCQMCNKSHQTVNCRFIAEMSRKERINFFKMQSLCFVCGSGRHRIEDCDHTFNKCIDPDCTFRIQHHKVFHGPTLNTSCLLYTSPSPRDYAASRMPSSA